jgi:cobalt-zinc-cadmium efflux system membrane fusion protein
MPRLERNTFKSWSPAKQWLWLSMGGVAAVAIIGVAGFHHSPVARAADPSPASGVVVLTSAQRANLTVATADIHDFRDISVADGKITTDNSRTVSVFSPFSGRIVQVMVQPGDRVAAGQALFSIDANEYAQGHSDLVAAQTNLDAAVAQEKLARDAETRAQGVYTTAGGALKDYQQAQHDLIAAQSATTAARAALDAERAKLKILGLSDRDVDALAASNTSAVVVRAPIAGVVASQTLSAGELLATGSAAALAITDTAHVWLDAQVSEADTGKVKVGDQVTVHVSAYPDRPYSATVVSVEPELNSDTHRLPVRAAIANTDGALKPEMFASFDIYGATVAQGLGVPIDAIVRDGDMVHVWVVDASGRAHFRAVQLGLVGGGFAEITSGLARGEQVVVEGSLFVDKAGAA